MQGVPCQQVFHIKVQFNKLVLRSQVSDNDHFVEAGLMTLREQKQLDYMHEVTQNLQQITWLPVQWAQAAIGQAKNKGLISSDFYFTILQKNLNNLYYEKTCGLISYAWINIPLVYTQLVTMAVHLFFFVRLLGMQYLQPTMFLLEDGQYVQVENGTPNAVNLAGYDDTIHENPVFWKILKLDN